MKLARAKDTGILKKDLKTQDGGLRYLALKNYLRKQILTGKLPHHGQIPSEPALCRKHALSRNTVQRAILELVDEGFLKRKQGRGTFVSFQRSREQQTLVGFLYPQEKHVETNSWERSIAGAQQCAEEHGFRILSANTLNDPHRSLDLVVWLNEAKAIGSLFIPNCQPLSEETNNEVLTALRNSGQQVVLVDTDVAGENDGKVSCVTCQNFEGSYAATRHLIVRGYRRIAYLRGPHRRSGDERFKGFLAAMSDAGLEVRPEYTLKVGEEIVEEQGVQEVDIFKALREPPEAVVCLHDAVALNVLRRCAERGIRVPDDLAVVGFDDVYQSRISHPPLTTVRQDLFRIGYRAMEILVGHVQGEITQPVIERLPCQLVVRKSCVAQ
jgi:GntR family transcriptional regulator, arabinose operon transcriptional repressor